ncbi:MAG: hypothetical protein K8W52_03650 [Deltaproteobacteria bacterium]|nr:hypothetical protein [Deltaproteobacteria bacterium]
MSTRTPLHPARLVAFAVAGLALPLAARTAHAGISAHLECAHDGGKPLPARARIVLDKLVACTIVIDKGAVPKDATATIVAGSVTPAGTAVVPRTADPTTTPRADHKAAFAPIASFSAGTDFMACSTVRFDASITQGTTVLWHGAVENRGACTSIKPLGGELTCIGLVHGAPIDYPGEGMTKKPSLAEAGVTCTVKIKGTGDAPQFVVFNVQGANKPPLARAVATDAKFPEPRAFAQLMPPLLPTCKNFVVQAATLRQDGAVLWSGTLKIPQSCAK